MIAQNLRTAGQTRPCMEGQKRKNLKQQHLCFLILTLDLFHFGLSLKRISFHSEQEYSPDLETDKQGYQKDLLLTSQAEMECSSEKLQVLSGASFLKASVFLS
jgi:hypothetical protein